MVLLTGAKTDQGIAVQVETGNLVEDIIGTGKVIPKQRYTLTSRTSGYVVSIEQEDDGSVQQGDLIAILENNELLKKKSETEEKIQELLDDDIQESDTFQADLLHKVYLLADIRLKIESLSTQLKTSSLLLPENSPDRRDDQLAMNRLTIERDYIENAIDLVRRKQANLQEHRKRQISNTRRDLAEINAQIERLNITSEENGLLRFKEKLYVGEFISSHQHIADVIVNRHYLGVVEIIYEKIRHINVADLCDVSIGGDEFTLPVQSISEVAESGFSKLTFDLSEVSSSQMHAGLPTKVTCKGRTKLGITYLNLKNHPELYNRSYQVIREDGSELVLKKLWDQYYQVLSDVEKNEVVSIVMDKE